MGGKGPLKIAKKNVKRAKKALAKEHKRHERAQAAQADTDKSGDR